MDLYKRRRIEAHIDLTPMIDTLLQLFLIFLLSATFIQSSFNLNLPKVGKEQPPPAGEIKRIVVSIDAENKLQLNSQPIQRENLLASLKPLLKQSETPLVILLADRKLSYEQVLDVVIEIQDSGVSNLSLAYDKKPVGIK